MARASKARKPTPDAKLRAAPAVKKAAPKPDAPELPPLPKVEAPSENGIWTDEYTARGRVISVMIGGATGTTTYEEVIKPGATEAEITAAFDRLKTRAER